ncbi:MAG: hypothetical protein CMJ64_26560 [Planctomycetaceae bacterium]|jgi:hypothetical protein|nr:hypothetical protein [Planctomycetaceae bacterium]
MDDKHTQTQTTEENILRHIVNAMLAVEHKLRDATTGEWTQTLVASCRIQRQSIEGEMCA